MPTFYYKGRLRVRLAEYDILFTISKMPIY